MKIQITNQQNQISLRKNVLRRLTLQLLPLAHRLDPDVNWEQIDVNLVDDTGIQQAHLQYFGKNTITDVISVRYDPFPGETGCSGEIIVNIQQATRARNARGWSPNRELALYIAHGLDHLHGGRDDTVANQQKMRRRELRWLRHLQHEGVDFTSSHDKVI